MHENNLIELASGNVIPQLGFGTWQLTGRVAYSSVEAALKVGYRHLDTASIYGNEEEVGQAIADSGIPREELFVTTKLWNSDQGHDSAIKAFDLSLKRLQLEYVDLYLIHWPVSEKRIESYKALEELQKQGLIKDIGVSNFMVGHLEELLHATAVLPAVNQIEMHPFNYLQRKDVVEFCSEHSIAIEAYSPLAQGDKLSDRTVKEIAGVYSISPAQVLIRWGIQHGFVSLPRSSNPDHIRNNFEVFDIHLEDEEMEKLNALDEALITTMNPEQF